MKIRIAIIAAYAGVLGLAIMAAANAEAATTLKQTAQPQGGAARTFGQGDFQRTKKPAKKQTAPAAR
jgi:hypothetical protein